jgi:hypothetical protein
MDFKIADEVVVKIRDNVIVDRAATNFDRLVKFEIVATYDGGYFVYVPQDDLIQDSIRVYQHNMKKLNLESRFIDSDVCYIEDDRIVKLYHRMPGMKCQRCDEFYQYAEPNQDDKSTMVCWSCRQNPYR